MLNAQLNSLYLFQRAALQESTGTFLLTGASARNSKFFRRPYYEESTKWKRLVVDRGVGSESCFLCLRGFSLVKDVNLCTDSSPLLRDYLIQGCLYLRAQHFS